jgi:hypothetical protein
MLDALEESMYCPKCGAVLSDGVSFCAHCGNPLVQGAPQFQASQPAWTSQPMTNMPGKNKTLVIVAVVVVVIIVVAAIAVLLMANSSHLEITNYTYTPTSIMGFVVFTVSVSNTGGATGSATIHCTVTFSNGGTYSNTESISLGAGQSNTYYVTVMTLGNYLDTSGTCSCNLS